MSSNTVYVDPRVQKVIELYADILAGDFYSLPVRRQLDVQAARLTDAHHNRDDSVCFQIGSWHPGLTGMHDDAILDHPFDINDGRTTIAREYGFRDWKEVDALADRRSDVKFEGAVNTMLSGDLSGLEGLIGGAPGLIGARSEYGHRANMLHYAGTNGVESYRQVVPSNLAEILDFLIAAGADMKSKAAIYGGSTPRELFKTSKHSYESNVYPDVIAVFEKYESGTVR